MNLKRLLLPILTVAACGGHLFAQSSLIEGDVAITALDASSSDQQFAFVPLIDLDAGTEIYFTDVAADGDFTHPDASVGAQSGKLLYTAPAGGVTAGTVVRWQSTGTPDFNSVQGNFTIGANGDKLIAYQGMDSVNVSEYLFAVASYDDHGSFPVGFNSALTFGPAGGSGTDDGEYTGTRTGSRTSLYSQITDINKWSVGSSVLPIDTAPFTVNCAPHTQASALSFIQIDENEISLGWARGDGDSILVVARDFDSTSTVPVDSVVYSADAAFGSGERLDAGNFAVYRGRGTMVKVTNLMPAHRYVFYLYEFNYKDGSPCYNVAQVFADTLTACSIPDEPVSVSAKPGNGSARVTWTNGACSDSVLVIASELPAGTAPVAGENNSDYAPADTGFGAGFELTPNEYVVYNGTGTSVKVGNLTNGQRYYFTVFNTIDSSWSAGVETSVFPQQVPSAGDLVINEIMYNAGSGDDEWIELYNNTADPISLLHYRLAFGVNALDIGDVVIPPGDYVTIALGSDGDGSFNNDKPFVPDTNALGLSNDSVAFSTNTDNLRNSSLSVRMIYAPNGANLTIDEVTYLDRSPWPEAADGQGPSLELIKENLDNTKGKHWLALTDGGTPGASNTDAYIWEGTTWLPQDPSGTNITAPIIVVGAGAILNDNTGTTEDVYVKPDATLDLGSFVLTVDTLHIESSAEGQGQVKGSVSGHTLFQSYINSPGARWFNVAFPVNSTGTLADVDLSNGGFLNSLSDVGGDTSFVNVYWYDTDLQNSATNEGTWRPVESLSAKTDTAAYSIYLGGSHFGSLPMTITSYGNLNDGLITHNLSQANGGWNFVPNPYATSLDWDMVVSDNPNINQTYYIFDDDLGDSSFVGYNAFAGTVPGDVDSIDQYIAPGQAFFVNAGTGNQVSYNSNHQIMSAPIQLYNMQPNPGIYVMVHTTDSMDDYAYVGFRQGVSDAYHTRFDGKKMMNTATTVPSLYSSLQGEDYMFKFVDDNFKSRSVPLHLEMDKEGQLDITAELRNIDPFWRVSLEDKLTGEMTDLRHNNYTFTHTGSNDPDRFVLHINKGAVNLDENQADQVYAYSEEDFIRVNLRHFPAGNSADIKLYDLSGRLIHDLSENGGDISSINMEGKAKGVYILKVLDSDETLLTQKVINQ